MKTLFYKACLFIIFIICSLYINVQSDSLKIDSLKKVLLTEKMDTSKIRTLINIGDNYTNLNITDEAHLNYFNALKLAEKIEYKELLFQSLYTIAQFYSDGSDNDKAAECALKAIATAEL